jgi:tetratricopeptide (TPR) repeat protein
MALTTLAPSHRKLLDDVSAAMRARNTRLAAALAQEGLSSGFRHPLLLKARALWSTEQGLHEAALTDFQQADELSLPDAAIKGAIGACLFKLERFGEAVDAYRAAVAIQPNNASLHCRLGWAHELGQDLVEARLSYQRALELAPDNPEILGRFAFLATRTASWAEARSLAERAVAGDSGHFAANLALATTDLEEGHYDAADLRLAAILADKNLAANNRYLALGLLGDLRDRQNRIAEAMAAFAASKDACRRHYSVPLAPDGTTMSQAVSLMTAHFGQLPSPPQSERSAAPASETTHYFLVGFLRSGTTLLEHALASNPRVVTLEERDPAADALLAFSPQSRKLRALADATEQTLDEYRERYWQNVRKYGVDPQDKIFIDKGPIASVKLPVLMRLFPNAKILFAIRDPRDVVLSCYRRRFRINPTTYEFLTLESTARFYDAVMSLSEIYRDKLPLDIYDIRYESVVDDFEGQTRALCNFMGLPWDDAMRRFSDRSKKGAVSTVSAPQIARGLNREGIGQWRRYAEHLAPVLPILRPWVEKFGYSAD